MINTVYQLIQPEVITADYRDLPYDTNVIVRPEYMSICKADMRYYFGMRSSEILEEKLPMALIHECCAKVIYDPSGKYLAGDRVIPVPNIPPLIEDDGYENYRKGALFASSGTDGFMQEFVTIPGERLVSYDNIEPRIAAMTEYVSVAVHAAERFLNASGSRRSRIGIVGDGSLGFVVANVLKKMLPDSKLILIGHNRQKFPMFSFVDETYYSDRLPKDLSLDHAFECVGGAESEKAVAEIIKHIKPQGTILLLGVSEEPVEIQTRMVLEKGLTLVGCSRSGKKDFEAAVKLMQDEPFQMRLAGILCEDAPVRCIEDIHRVFQNDRNNLFKTVFKWEL